MKNFFGLVPEQASTIAANVDYLYFFISAITVFFTFLILGLAIYFGIKYRRRSEDERPEPIHGNLLLEITWTLIPLVIAMFMFYWGAYLYIKNSHIPKDAVEVFVVGKQWMWKIQHPTGHREINTLHVPVNTPIRLLMTSEDVIHSFYIPAFRIKKDTVPGRYTSAWFEAEKTGTYHLFCAEYCGTSHSQMIGSIVVMPKEDYQQWLVDTDPLGNAVAVDSGSSVDSSLPIEEQGKQLFEQLKCNTCHVGQKDTPLGPSLYHIMGKKVTLQGGRSITIDENYVRESIVEPQKKLVQGYGPVMPSFASQLSELEIMALVSYVKSLSGGSHEKESAIEQAVQKAETELNNTLEAVTSTASEPNS